MPACAGASAVHDGRNEHVACRGRHVKHSGYQMYADSKLMLYMFTVEMQKRFTAAGSSVETFAAHPGVAQTDAFRKSDKSKPAANLLASGAKFLGQSAGGGAQSILKALTDPALTGESDRSNTSQGVCALQSGP